MGPDRPRKPRQRGLGLFDLLLFLGLRVFLSSVVVIFTYVHLFTSH